MKVQQVTNLEQAIQLLSTHPEAKIVAGGTDLIPRINQNIESHDSLFFLKDIKEMTTIKKDDKGQVYLGALVRLTELSENPLLQEYTALIQAAIAVASPQIRNVATIGGNILQENRCMYFNQTVNWSKVEKCYKLGGNRCYQYTGSKECVALFQSDVAPVLMSFGATALIFGKNGYREVLFSELYLNAGLKKIEHEEILVAVKIPPITGRWHSAYIKKTIRGSFDFPLISCAVLLKEDSGKIVYASIVMGAAGVKPREVMEANLLVGKEMSNTLGIASEIEKSITKYIAPFRDTRVDFMVRRAMGQEVFLKTLNMAIKD